MDPQSISVTKEPNGMVRVANAPLISTGIEYPLFVGGKVTFTEDMLQSAVAALEDPAIVAPRIKLGHTSDYNLALVGDAEQAFGKIDASSMYIGDNGQTIYGDYIVPEWLGNVMAIAYPNRSVEAAFDVETATGKHYEFVITAVSLIGIYWPGCQVLEDLPLWYGGDIPDGITFDDEIASQLADQAIAAKGGKVNIPGRSKSIEADADTSRIRRQFYEKAMSGDLAGVPEGTDTYWWWIRGERLGDGKNPYYLIVEDDENGDMYRFDVKMKGEDAQFSDPVPVSIQYVEKTAASLAAVAAGMASMDDRLVVFASGADTGGPDKTNQEGVLHMDEAQRKKLAAHVGLPDTATEAEINAKVTSELLAGNPLTGVEGGEPDNAGKTGKEVKPEDEPPAHQTPPGTAPSGTGTHVPDPVSTEGEPAPESAEDVEAGVVRVDKATWEQTKAGAALARKHENELVTTRQAGKVTAAIQAGKIPPSRKDHYTKLMAADEQGTTELLDGLEQSAVPLREIGSGGAGGEGDDLQAGNGQGLPDSWFPEIAARRAAATAPKPVTQAREG